MISRKLLAGFLAACSIIVGDAVHVAPYAIAGGSADEADLHFELGAIAYRDGKFTEALEHFLASNRLAPNRNVMFNIARAFEQLRRYPDAYRYYTEALRGESDESIVKELQAALVRISPQVAVIEVVSQPVGATVYVQRKNLGSVAATPARLGFAAGKYTIIVEAPGYEPVQLGPYDVTAGSTTKVNADLKLIVGAVRFDTGSGVQVRVDSETEAPACITPCKLDLTPGAHTLFFSKQAFAAPPRVVTVEANQEKVIAVALAPITGSLLVNASETGAAVEVDGKLVGYTPMAVPNLAIGRRRVRVSLRGYVAVERDIEVKANAQVELDGVILEPLRQVSAASRTAESIEDAPASVSIISAAEMDAFAYPTILEALRGTRGFSTSYDSVYGNASIRGLGQANDYNNRILVLSDGAVLNENILYQPFVHYDGRTDLGDVERIEVVRGPGSVLYGTGAVSGVVNLVPRAIEPGSEIQVSTYDNSVARGRARFAHRFGNGAKVAVSVAGARSGGRDETLATAAGPTAVSKFDAFTSGTLNVRGEYKALTGQVFYTRRNLVVPTGNFGNAPGDTRNRTVDSRLMGELRWEPKLSARTQLLTRAHVNTGYYFMDYRFAVEEENLAYEQRYHEKYTAGWAGAEARITQQLNPRLKLSAGAELVRHFSVHLGSDFTNASGETEAGFDINSPYAVYAGYALADIRPTDKLFVQVGARVDRWDLSQAQKGATTNAAIAEDFTSVSPRLAVIAKPAPRDVLKLMGGRAFRAPSIYEYYYNDRGITQSSSDCCGARLAPETVYSGEFEYTRKVNRDWSALGSLYGTVARNIIETVPVPEEIRLANDWAEGVSHYASSSVDQRMFGGDVEVRREWRGGKLMSAQYGYLYARYAGAAQGDATATRTLPNSPTHYFSWRGVVPVVPELANAALRLSFEDARRINVESAAQSKRGVIADFVISGRATKQHVRYNVGVYNLFNWKLAQGGEPFASPVLPQLGRSFMLSLTLER